jgi:Uma2 family endonuclease
MPVVVEDKPNWVKGSRVPDLMIYDKARWEEYKANTPDWGDKPFVLVPDLCVEVISPTDKYSDVDAKVAGYLRDGVRLVWVFDPREKAVNVHTSSGSIRLTRTDMLDGGEVLPGFKLPLSDLFQP